MHGHQLTLQMGGQLRDHDPLVFHAAPELIAVGLAFSGQRHVDERRVADGHLNTDEAEVAGPAGHRFDGVERRVVRHELRQKYRRALECLHRPTRAPL